MERIWKLGKAVAFILSLSTFIYVGNKISQMGRYQSATSETSFIITDTQTGAIQYFSLVEGRAIYKNDLKNMVNVNY